MVTPVETPGVDMFGTAYAVSNWLDEFNGADRAEIAARLLKVGEEFGEVVAAWIAATGQNPRKGPASGDFAAVGAELADVVMTSLVAIASLGLDVDQVMTDCTNKITARVNGQAERALIGDNGSLGRES